MLGRDRLRRGLSVDRRHEPPVFSYDEQRVIYGDIRAITVTQEGILAVKIHPDGAPKDKLIGYSIRKGANGKKITEEGAWILWGESFSQFMMHQPSIGDPVQIVYTGNKPSSGFAQRISRIGTSDPKLLQLKQRGPMRSLSAVGLF